ncbi:MULTISPECIES: DUF6603 domain-containing protein [unclassified Nocardioides]|uniref:DUF6603 domain-containing protein n=1 Tax=unclassified Nocardioides TaxID=2615069 RepID=UPI0036238169
MAIEASSLGSFGDLATALGILDHDGAANAAWFENPVTGGTGSTAHGLKHVMADTGQRDALLRFVDGVLGPPEARTEEGARWVPLFQNDDPVLTVFAVVEPVPASHEVRLGVGVEHTTSGGPPTVSTRLHVPLFRFADRDHDLGPGDVPWLLLGRAGGGIELAVDTTITDTAPPAGEASLGGVAASVTVPTDGSTAVSFGLTLRDLQLPGATSPRTFSLDAASPEEFGTDLLDLLAGLVRAQADALAGDPDFRPFVALAGMLGLRDVPDLPALPLADLPTRGIAVLVEWVEGLLADDAARDAWLTQLADLVGGTADAARDAVVLDLAPLQLAIGVRVEAGTGGHPVLVPWVEVSLRTQPGTPVLVRAAVDLLRADTGTGTCTAVPDVRLEGVFGDNATGRRLIGPAATDTPRVDSLRVGLALDADRNPVFVLTAHGVRLVPGALMDVVDLSTPQAVLDAGASVLTAALDTALDALGTEAAPLVKRLLGVQPPAGVTGLDAAALIANPVDAVRGYWERVVASTAGMADVLGHLARLLAGHAAAALPEEGTEVDPWRIEVVDPLFLEFWREGTTLHADVAVSTSVAVLGDLTCSTALSFSLLAADPAAGTVAFAQGARLGGSLGRADGEQVRLAVGDLALVVDRIAVDLVWRPTVGLRPELLADGLALELPAPDPVSGIADLLPVPLPRLDDAGRLAFDAPDWQSVERAIAHLVRRLGIAEVDALVDLLGWYGGGTRLALDGLLGGDPAVALESWLADLLLDCGRVRAALGPVAGLLSGFAIAAPLGTGNANDPYRCPVAGEPRAPGLRAWLDPGCSVRPEDVALDLSALLSGEPPETETIAAILRSAGPLASDLAELMVGRDSLGAGLQALVDRWAGTDGLVGMPSLPDGVTGLVVEGVAYDKLVALGGVGDLPAEVLDPLPAAVVHVGCEASWLADKPAGTTVDATGAPVPQVPDDASGSWFVRIPTPTQAAADRPDLGTVGAQAALLDAALSDRAAPYVLIGYGAAGAAALRVAASRPAVTAVVTVGTPWGAVATDALSAGLGGDALRLLRRLARPDVEAAPEPVRAHESSDLQRMRELVARTAAHLDPTALPNAALEARRAGMPVHAVFGDLDADALARGLGAYVADGILARTEARVTAGPAVPATALHVALDLPVFDLDLGGLLVGAGAAVELCRIGRPAAGPGIEAGFVRGVVVELHLGVHDGWLVGGPGSTTGGGDLRWMSARVEVPLTGEPGTAELVLHEATGLGIDRERWVVHVDPTAPTVDAVVPEVRGLLSGVVTRLSAASASLASLLDLLGLRTDRGLDPAGLDRLLLDTAATVRSRIAAAPAPAAAALRALVTGATGSGTTIGWTSGPVGVSLDLATGATTAQLAVEPVGGLALALDLAASATWARATLAVGGHDDALGGVRLVAATPTGPGQPVTASLEVAVPARPLRTVALWPDPAVPDLTDVAALCLPALGIQALATAALRAASEDGRPLVLAVLDALGLVERLGAEAQRLRLPIAAVADPAAWVAALARSGSVTPGAAGVALLDALAPLVAPDRGTDPGWPLAPGVRLDYAQVGDRLRLTAGCDLDLDLDVDTVVTTRLEVGAVIGADAPPAPVVEASVAVDGVGLRLTLDPGLRVALLRSAPSDPLPLFPDGPGLGEALGAAAGSLVPLLLDELAGLATSTDPFARSVGEMVADLGDALALRTGGRFREPLITAFADDPAGALLRRLPAVATTALTTLVDALDPGHALVAVSGTGPVTLTFGTSDSVSITITTTGPPTIDIAADWAIPDVGTVALESLRISAAGVAVAARIGPVPVTAGPVVLRPLVHVRAGTAATDGRLLGIGLALDDEALRAVELRWTLDATPPSIAGVTRSAAGAEISASEAAAGPWLLSLAVGLVAGVVSDALGTVLDDARLQRMLDGVLFSSGRTIDAGFADDLLDPDALLHRLERLLWNTATDPDPLSIEIDGAVTIALASTGPDANHRQLGINVNLVRPFEFPTSGVKVELEVDSSWLLPEVTGGLTVYAVSGTRSGDDFSFELDPGVTVAGVGLRFTNEAGPLLDLGVMSLDGIALHLYGEAVAAGVGGGVQLELAGFSFAPSAGGGDNPVANGIMNDAGEQASPANRPAFSPAFSIQQHPTDARPRISVRAGQPPGPWWLLVQRQLGPLYLERVGFDSRENEGRVVKISLLFDGRVEIFGLTAAVEQLSISWLGGDVLEASSWSVDLLGLAISADMGGVVLAGGLLKTEVEGNPGYVGMLLGRFGIYGLSVFGGYTALGNDPSFFVFGAVNGPIGGPPAFFITGLGGGLGINRKLVVPDDPSGFPQYPFIMALDPYADIGNPMDRLRELNLYFPPELGTFWFAGGISFTCFSLVDGIAVLAVSFGNAGLDINLLGLARMALPNPAAPLVSIELGLLIRFSTSEGVFMMRAALTDNSWLLYEDVRLTGGFALCFWWKGPLSGQFVLSLGGYHPDFHRDGYPVVPRLGLVWQVSDDIVIKGESFFALTSEALMAGVSVTAIADFGWAWARATFGAQGLVYFDPFWFTAEAWAQVSAGIEIDTWLFGTISISITIGARVQVEGPEFSGKASVEVGPCTVTIPFGSQRDKPTPVLGWTEFVTKYLEEASPGRARAITAITGRGSLPPATGGSASTPTPDGTAEHPYEVYAEFEITITTTVPTATFDIGGPSPATVSVKRSDNAPATLGLKPMNAGSLSSTLRLRLSFFDQDRGVWVDDPDDLRELAAHSALAFGSFPMGVWASPDRPVTAQPALPTGDVVNAGNQVTLTAVASQLHPGPMINYYTVEAGRRPLPLRQPTGTDRTGLLARADDVPLPTVGTVQDALDFAAARLFAPPPATVAGGPLPNGSRSNVARAGYRRDVAAPPLLGKLTDGLAITNADDAAFSEQDPPAEPAVPAARAPRVVGYLTGGTRVASRLGGTTVSDRERKRRTAPSIASVHTRLGRSLPVRIAVDALPADKVGSTFTPRSLPFTAAPGSARSFGLGEGPAATRVAGLSGLGGAAPKGAKAARLAGIKAASETGAPALVSGDVVALHAPDHGADVAARRPVLDLGGTARLTCLGGDGSVLHDEVVSGAQEVPAGSELVVVQADGTLDDLDGLAGWHSRARVAGVGSGTGIAAGCVLDVEAPHPTPGVTWTTAGDLVRDADAVTTRFARPVTCVALVVEADDPDRVGELGLELHGATRATGAGGTPVEPSLIANGTQSIAVYPVVPDPDGAGVSVRFVAGTGWRVTGVLGSTETPDAVVAGLRRYGVAASTGRLLAVAGAGCRPAWQATRRTR